jgi:hypothetical protein
VGGRGSYSYSGKRSAKDGSTLSAYAVASLNRGAAGGTTVESAIDRFREQLMDNRYEHSAYIDDAGYVHALGSTGKEGSTRVAPLSSVAHEKGVSTIIHNHPHGGSDGRKWGGPLSGGDLEYIASAYNMSGGRVKRIVATSNEGTYSALVTKSVSGKAVRSAVKRADATVRGRKYQSEIAMWRAVNKAYTSEFAKIGIEISYEKQPKKSGLLVTQKTGTYA